MSKSSKSTKEASLPAKEIKEIKPLFESQKLAEAPNQTYYQVVVQPNEITLRDWPKKRASQKWTRDSAMNPSSKKTNFQSFLEGELKDEIKNAFGQDVVEKITTLAQSNKKAKTTHS